MLNEKGQIVVAGAGAGKTYGMAQKILSRREIIEDHKKIFAITFTNAATNKIEEELKKRKGSIPDNVRVSTIHSFLLNEIVYPFSPHILDQSFQSAVSCKLDSKPQYKNYRLKELNKQSIIHNEQVFKKSKMITVISKSDKKELKYKKATIMKHLQSDIDSIFVDEAQDADEDLIKVFTALVLSGIYIYMVGDPKQNLWKGSDSAFSQLIQRINDKQEDSYNLDYMIYTSRLGLNHLKVSNLLCSPYECQERAKHNDRKGKVEYVFLDDNTFDELFNTYNDLASKSKALIYIDKKCPEFNTRQMSSYDISFPEAIDEKIRQITKLKGFDYDALLYFYQQRLIKNAKKLGTGKAVSKLLDDIGISYNKNDYAALCSQLSVNSNDKKIKTITTIHKVRGLESENCMFIMCNALLERLLSPQDFNDKIKNQLYVGLTRSKNRLILVINTNGLNIEKNVIEANFESIGIKAYNV